MGREETSNPELWMTLRKKGWWESQRDKVSFTMLFYFLKLHCIIHNFEEINIKF